MVNFPSSPFFLINRGIFCSRSEWQRPVKPRCFMASQLAVDKDWAPEGLAGKSQSHGGQRVGVCKVSLHLTESYVINGLRH